MKIAAFFFELSRLGLWPLDENLRSSSLDTIFDQLSMFQDFTTNQAIAKCDTCSFSFKNKLADVVVQQRALLKGLCLSCAKHGRMNARAGNCQESQSCSVDETAFQAHRLKCARI